MGVPAGDQRDHDFAKEFNIKIPEIFENIDCSQKAHTEKNITLKNSGILNGLSFEKANELISKHLFIKQMAFPKVNFKLRDAIFSRQRYWGAFSSLLPKQYPIHYRRTASLAPKNQ